MHPVNTLKIYAMGLLFLLLMSGALFGGTRDPKIADQHYVEYGKKFKSVVRIRASGEKGMRQYASAVIIRPHWVLTAAHVVIDTTEPTVLMNDDKDFYPLSYMLPHTGFDTTAKGNHHDIALGYSDKDFGLEFYTPLYTNTDETDKLATLAGIGLHGTFNTGHTFSDTTRRAGSNHIERVQDSVLICTPSRNRADRLTSMEFFISPGDSGGGLFIGNELAGIHSFIMASRHSPSSKYDEESGHTRISLYADWVESQIAEHELKLKVVEK
jgi:hypothetical protein